MLRNTTTQYPNFNNNNLNICVSDVVDGVISGGRGLGLPPNKWASNLCTTPFMMQINRLKSVSQMNN